jgi:hypothetical protein
VLKNLLTDKLTLAVAIGGEPNPLDGMKGLTNGLELGGFVSAPCGASAVKSFGSKKYRRPALPGRHNILRFEEIEQVAFGREDFSITSTDGGADVFCLAGFLRDDDLNCHASPSRRNRIDDVDWNIKRTSSVRNLPFDGAHRSVAKQKARRRCRAFVIIEL